ncbi:MAG: asparagine synthase (glutamine-hydrolyzing) [Verrucomicrobiales bacterium]
MLTPYFEAPTPRLLINKLSLINMRLKGAHLILPKVERTLGAHGITPLSPLFDEDLIDLSFRIPPTLKLERGIEKIIMKQAFAKRVPQSVIDRPKVGMRVPVYHWMQKELKRYAKSILSPKRLRADGIFNEERVKQLLSYRTEEGPGRYGIRLWMLITFHIWKDTVLDKN